MKKYVRVLKIPECGYFVIGDRTKDYSVDEIVDVSEYDQEDILNLINDKFLKEVQVTDVPH